MLVLTRKLYEAIAIGDDVVVKVMKIGRTGQIRLGIEAPREMRIRRVELETERGDEEQPGPTDPGTAAETGVSTPSTGLSTDKVDSQLTVG